MVKVSGSQEITTTDETDLFVVPGNYIGYLRRLEIVNKSASLATIQLKFYNGDVGKVVLNKAVAAGGTLVLAENELPTEGVPTKITVTSDSQPIRVDYSLDLR